MKKIISFMIGLAMLSASVYAVDEAVEVNTAVSQTAEPQDGQIGADVGENDIAYEEDHLPDGEEGFAVTTAGRSEGSLPELGDIDKYLAMNGYPDYLSFICNTAAAINGYDPSSGEEYQPMMTYWWDVGVVNATSAQKTEIETLINELYPIDNIITFVDCTYSYNEREALIPEIRQTVEELFPTVKVVDVSLIRNTEQIALHLDFSADGDVPEPEMVREKMYAVYGDLLFMGDFGVTTDDGYDFGGIPTVGIGAATEIGEEEIDVDEAAFPEGDIAVASNVDGEAAPPIGGDYDSAPAVGEIAAIAPIEKDGSSTVLWVCIAAALVIVLGTVAFIYRAKLIPIFAASHGDVTAQKMSKKQTEEAVKNSEVIPDDSVLQAIKEKIDK